jgi:Putative outer membrane beta-barrel porin, MtrB/PioB
MHRRLLTVSVAFLFASVAATAQTPQPTPSATPAPPAQRPVVGTVDFGGLFTTADGDAARYERYRDTPDGVYSGFTLNRTDDTYLFDASASHIGYRDQRYRVGFFGPRANVTFNWLSLPLNFSYLTRTAYVTNGTTLTLDDGAQRAVQGPTIATTDGTAVGVPCAPGAPPGACGTAALAAQAKANRSIYNNLATPFDLGYLRNTATVGLMYAATKGVDVDASFTSSKRSGQQPFGASFAFNNAIEVPLPLDQRTSDVKLGASWTKPRGMFRVGWDGSWFTNQFQSMVWDNPVFLTDYNNGLLPPNGPYDPSGYSNGNGPAQGRMSVAPDNMMNVVSATGLYKLVGRTTLNGTVQLTTQNQNDDLIPWTINSVIADSPAVIAAFRIWRSCRGRRPKRKPGA